MIFLTATSFLLYSVRDFAFYGNKLFQGTFIKVINPHASLFSIMLWTLLNSGVALIGYYFAAFTIDRKWMGRKRMQAFGFLMVGLLFLFCTVFYHKLIQPGNIHAFQFLYYFSSFWGQFGPNATTWLLPAELSPTEVRSACHGFSAAVGKAGALVAGVVFSHVSDQTKFTISAICGLIGAVITFILIPDITGLDLREGDKRWLAVLDGKHSAYTGPAVDPKHLSLFERMLGYGRQYKSGEDKSTSTRPGGPVSAARYDGDHHTHLATVSGMVVSTVPEPGAGPDDLHEMRQVSKDASFQARSLPYM